MSVDVQLPPGVTALLVDTERVLLPIVGHKQVLVASKSYPGHAYCVSWEFNDQRGIEEWICTCRGFEVRHSCRHVKAIDRWNAGKAAVKFIYDEGAT